MIKRKPKRRKNSYSYLRESTCEEPISNPRMSRYRESLKVSSKKFDNYDDFQNSYWKGASRGIYWIGVDQDYEDDESALLEKEFAKKKELVAYISPLHILDKPFAAEVNTALLDPDDDFKKNVKDPRNSIKITAPNMILVNYVYPIKKAIEVWKYNSRYQPSSGFDLKTFWVWAEKEPVSEVRPIQRRKRKKKVNDTKKEN